MEEKERAFRERMARIARITRIQKLEEIRQIETKEEKREFEILPAICKVKKNIENFRTKPMEEVQER